MPFYRVRGKAEMPPPPPTSMTFKGDHTADFHNEGDLCENSDLTQMLKYLTIYENLRFKVEFSTVTPCCNVVEESFDALGITSGFIVEGKITETGGAMWTDSTIEGKAQNFSSNNPDLSYVWDEFDAMSFSLKYDANFTTATIEFTKLTEDFAEFSQKLMGGIFNRVNN